MKTTGLRLSELLGVAKSIRGEDYSLVVFTRAAWQKLQDGRDRGQSRHYVIWDEGKGDWNEVKLLEARHQDDIFINARSNPIKRFLVISQVLGQYKLQDADVLADDWLAVEREYMAIDMN